MSLSTISIPERGTVEGFSEHQFTPFRNQNKRSGIGSIKVMMSTTSRLFGKLEFNKDSKL